MDFVQQGGQQGGDRFSALVTIASISVATLYADERQSKSNVHEIVDTHQGNPRRTHNKASSTPSSLTTKDVLAARPAHDRRGQQSEDQCGNKRTKTDFILVTDIQHTAVAQHLYIVPSSLIPSKETIREFQIYKRNTRKKEIKTYKGTIIAVGAFGDDGEPSKAKILYNDGECKTESIRKLHFLF
jgi:hypothetical protein